MCGIAGIIATQPLTPELRSRVLRMNDRETHRGPDGEGVFHDGPVALAMRRLSIIDVKGGHQPLFNEDKSVALVANGEIYNAVELRALLRSQGHQFRTGSDCEVIVHLYEQYDLECVQHMRGMFAFALWDSRLRRLVLGRDRMGEKPLYLSMQNGVIYFASELKALIASGAVPFELEPTALDLFFHYNYVPEPMTPVRGVQKLPAAHLLTIDADTWKQERRCYWRMEDAPALTGNPADLIRAELDTISELIIRADVPVGIALSGGLDSSVIAAMTARKYPGSMQAFSVGYHGRRQSDERSDAKAFAEHLGMPFHEVELRSEDLAAFFPELVFWADDPIGDISAYGYYCVMRAAKAQGVSVMLQGHGGDELFWGYPWVREAVTQTARKLRSPRFHEYVRLTLPAYWSPWGIKEWIKSAAGLRTAWTLHTRDRLSPKEQAVFYDLTPDFLLVHEQMPALYEPAFAEQLSPGQPYSLFTRDMPWPSLDVMITQLICQTYLAENGIAQGDRLSMASSVELRLPLVDYRLVETVIGLRKASPDHALPPKAWFRSAVKDLLPDWVMNRPKRGFTPPLDEWHRALFAAHGARLDGGFLVSKGILSPSSGRALAKGPYPPEAGAPISFKALTLELWCRQMDTAARRATLDRQLSHSTAVHAMSA